jgi:catechol-2,3-dioxygenase
MSTTDSPTTTFVTGHIGLNVTDLDRSTAFYREVFGFDLAGEGQDGDRRWAFLAADGRLVVTLWQQAGAPFSPGAAGLHHLSFEVPTIDDVRAAETRLRAIDASFTYDGVVPHGAEADSGGIFFTDPDGTRLEIYAPTGAGGQAAPHDDAPTCGFF